MIRVYDSLTRWELSPTTLQRPSVVGRETVMKQLARRQDPFYQLFLFLFILDVSKSGFDRYYPDEKIARPMQRRQQSMSLAL